MVQLATRADVAPVAYSLSLVAAVTYALGWVAIRRASEGRTAFASRMLWVELAGVLTVGTLSLVEPDWFPDASVWSDYGIGYGFVPRRCRSPGCSGSARRPGSAGGHGLVTAFRVVAFAEAVSWLGLLVGMFFKYVVDAGEAGCGCSARSTARSSSPTGTLRRHRAGRSRRRSGAGGSVPPFCRCGSGRASGGRRPCTRRICTAACSRLAGAQRTGRSIVARWP